MGLCDLAADVKHRKTTMVALRASLLGWVAMMLVGEQHGWASAQSEHTSFSNQPNIAPVARHRCPTKSSGF